MRRSTLVILVIFVLLGALTWIMQQPGNPVAKMMATATSVPSSQDVTFVGNKNGPISQITIRDASSRTVSIEKIDNRWVIKTDPVSIADQTLADTLVAQAMYLRIIKKLDTTPDPTGTGLNKPAYTISLVFGDGTSFSFKIGNATVTHSGYYAATEDGHVYILGKDEVDALTKVFTQSYVQTTITSAVEIMTETPTLPSAGGTGDSLPTKQP